MHLVSGTPQQVAAKHRRWQLMGSSGPACTSTAAFACDLTAEHFALPSQLWPPLPALQAIAVARAASGVPRSPRAATQLQASAADADVQPALNDSNNQSVTTSKQGPEEASEPSHSMPS